MRHDESRQSRRKFSWVRAWNGTRYSVRGLGSVVAILGVAAWMLQRLHWFGGLAVIAIGVILIFLGSISIEIEHEDENRPLP